MPVNGQVKSLAKTISIDFDLLDRVLLACHCTTRYQDRSFLLPGTNKQKRRAANENEEAAIHARDESDQVNTAGTDRMPA
jgi:hypothetical protein